MATIDNKDDHPTMEKCIKLGARFILCGSDVTFLMEGAQARSKFIREIHN